MPPRLAQHPTTKVIIILPCEGTPYIWKNKTYSTKTKKDCVEISKELHKAVRGEAEIHDASSLKIHPMFENRWRIASILAGKDNVELFLNSDGLKDGMANMACLCVERDTKAGKAYTAEEYLALPMRVRRDPFFGDVALVVPYATLMAEVSPSAMKLVRVEDYYKEMDLKETPEPADEEDYERHLGGYIYEPFDGEDAKKFKTFAKEKGWFLGPFGQVFMTPTGRPDERETTDYDEDDEEDC